jgi:hypothetical protein
LLPSSFLPGRVHALGLVLVLLAALPAAGAVEPPAAGSADLGLVHPAGCGHGPALRAAPMTRDLPALVEGVPGLGPATDQHAFALEECTGAIRPGARMTSPAGCTFNFVFRDAALALYIGTAGHCVSSVGQRVSASGVGSFGAVAYRRLSGNVDFALVKVDADKHHLVNPTMCSWGGPIGADPGGASIPRRVLLEYGWGFFTDGGSDTRTRAHVERSASGGQMTWVGVGSGGDSGAPILTQGGYAAAIHTFGTDTISSGWGFTSEGGPTFATILAAGRTAVPTLELVTGDPTDLVATMGELTYP